MDTRLCRPASWCAEDDTERRPTCHGPDEVPWHPTPPLAVARWRSIRHEGRRPCQSLVADGLSGQSPDGLEALEACVGGPSLVSRPAETRGGLQRPATVDKTSTDKGPVRPKRVLAPLAAPALPVDAFAHRLSPSRWSRRTVSEGTKGPLASACAHTRVTRGKEGLPERTGGLVSTRTLGARPTEA